MSLLPAWRRPGRDRRAALFVLGGLVVSVAVVYLVVVLGGGLLIGETNAPNLALSVLATAVVALGFSPLQTRLEAVAGRLVLGGRPSPYDVLSRFSTEVSGAYGGEQLPSRMAQVLGEGTGARWAQVWLVVNERHVLAATWPEDAQHDATPAGHAELPGLRTRVVRHAGEVLGELRLQEEPRQPLTPVEERLFAGLAAQAGLVLRGASLRAELAERIDELSIRSDELRHSRERLVDTQDAERRALERDIHDGAQQHLVALAVNLRLAQTLAAKSPDRAAHVLAEQVRAADAAIETLLDLSRGIYPRTLTEDGIAVALRAAVQASALPVEVIVTNSRRLADEVEAAVYFCCLEAIQNAAKHSGAGSATVSITIEGSVLAFEIEDDGHGFDLAAAADGDGLANMRDRIDAVGGTVTVATSSSGGTSVVGRVPLTMAEVGR